MKFSKLTGYLLNINFKMQGSACVLSTGKCLIVGYTE